MKPSIQKLQKFFKLEAERGYDNRAVLGGLERMLDRWEGEARLDGLPEELIQLIITRIRDYSRLTEKSRAETLQGLWKRLQRMESGKTDGLETESDLISQPDSEGEISTAVPPEKPQTGAVAGSDEPAGKVPDHNSEQGKLSFETFIARQAETTTAPVIESGKVRSQPRPEVRSRQKESHYRPAAEHPEPKIRLQPLRSRSGSWSAAGEPAALNASLTVLEGVGPQTAGNLERLGLYTLRDLLYFFPRRYVDFTTLRQINRLVYGEEVTVIGTIQSVHLRPVGGGRQMVEVIITDGSGSLRVTWFNPFLARRLHPGLHISLSGKVEQYLGRLLINSPEWEPVGHQALNTNRIVPYYPLTTKVTQEWLRKMVMKVISHWAMRLTDPLPANIRQGAGLVDLPTALLQIHFPDSQDDLHQAQSRLAFDEILLLQLGVLSQKSRWENRTGRVFEVNDAWIEAQTTRLPYPLTGAQHKALLDLRHDFVQGHPMNRLVQGDVGSGKTVVAALAALMVIEGGAQAAVMAPTAILAEQHYQSLLRLLTEQVLNTRSEMAKVPISKSEETSAEVIDQSADQPEAGLNAVTDPAPLPELEAAAEALTESPEAQPADLAASSEPSELAEPVAPPPLNPEQIRLLVGATSEAEKDEIRRGLAEGAIKLVIGTHALIEDPVVFQDLQLVVVDEQHRFGVDQRAALRSKGDNPHLLVMTATPIPRSLALTVYGDLDVTVIDELPPGRQPVSTYVLMPRERERAYSLIRSQVAEGRQAFIIYPLIDASNDSNASEKATGESHSAYAHSKPGNGSGRDESSQATKAAVAEHDRLQREIFANLNVGLLHGRMRPDEKDAVMEAFRNGTNQILVSTTVVEVGVDVPNATVMLIENANRFGLAQLHQLRGRVGRGAGHSICLLVPDSPDEAENERLQVMAATNDGFLLAEKDLEQRGPGQFLGTRQSGYADLQLAHLTDIRLIESARRHAQALFEQDPELSLPENQFLASALQQAWGGKGDIS